MKIFIDCGAFNGRYMKRFKANPRYKGFERFIAFECNPALLHIKYGLDVETIRKAVWIEDGHVNFYMNKARPTIEGHSVYKEKKTGNLDRENPISAECIDFSKWLFENLAPEDYVVVKMNIEGAEYDVLEKCVLDGSIALINELHIQWHVSKINIPLIRHRSIRAVLENTPTLKLYNGYGQLNQKA